WTAADPIGIADGANRYSYVGGRPISSTDISGLAEGRLAQPLTAFAQKLAGEKISDGINGFFNPPDDGGGGDVADVDDGAGDGEVEAITNNDPSRPATPKNTAFVQELRERDANIKCSVPESAPSPESAGPSMSVNRGDSVPDYSQTQAGRRQAAALYMSRNGIAAIVR